MQKHTLFVCKSCGITTEQEKLNGLSGGKHLLNQLMDLYAGWSHQADLKIQSVGCLCICDRPCAIAIASPEKPTFLFVGLPAFNMAPDLLQLCKLYIESEDGFVPRFQLPDTLQSARLARVPPLS